ncbi:FAD:protein FMN transferase [Megalodesulfovibrio gigas]|uniref:FAD:protein FMN transferase n=1 Tax=Megalodesulfovibrio gigas (strain ATCC 19364 / DSM 1382 / NCIMB 9332 / VKM B-1759) TaxID=1121448 RepID=T2G9K0_MEGG1|nr:FAD:protein FMN transferase [Megalodesulfovibrio gigas]AGW13270.1 putative ApbE family lipoprotein [Megalodesulfovibrio gigas DSM 1382 = ATCC 19364]
MKHTDSTRCSRRAVLKRLGLVAGGLALAPTLRVLPALAAPALKQSSETRLQLGTMVEMTALAPSKDQARDAMAHAFAEIDRLAAIFSRFDDDAALAALNAHGRLDHAPDELLTVLDHSRLLTRQSQGAFDMTIAPVVALLERTHGEPDPADLRAALELVDAARLRQDANSLRLDAAGMAVTLDGIAKGYIADRAADELRRHGVAHFCINAGGDIRVQGSPEGLSGGRAWRVAIEDPDKGGRYPAVLSLADGAVATSGGYEIFFDAGKTAHHLVDPATGRSPRQVKSVSVQAPTVMQADGLATALSVMPPRQALALIAMLPQHECLLLTADGAHLSSSGWGRERV